MSAGHSHGDQGLLRFILLIRFAHGSAHLEQRMVGGILAKIFWDTNLFIYLMEENPTFAHRVAEIRRGMLSRGDNLYTSAFTVGEILVKPSVTGRSDLESQYRAF